MNEQTEDFKHCPMCATNEALYKELLEVVAMMEALGSYDSGDNDEKVAQLESDIQIGIDRIRRYPEFYKEYAKHAQGGTD